MILFAVCRVAGGHAALIYEALFDARLDSLLVLPPVLLVELRGHRVGRGIGVRVAQQRLNGCEYCGYVVGGAPTVLQYIETDTAVCVHVRVKHVADEAHGRRLVGVFLRELDRKLERAILERCVVRPKDHSIPDHDVVVRGGATHAGGRVLLQSFKVPHKTATGWRRHSSILAAAVAREKPQHCVTDSLTGFIINYY